MARLFVSEVRRDRAYYQVGRHPPGARARRDGVASGRAPIVEIPNGVGRLFPDPLDEFCERERIETAGEPVRFGPLRYRCQALFYSEGERVQCERLRGHAWTDNEAWHSGRSGDLAWADGSDNSVPDLLRHAEFMKLERGATYMMIIELGSELRGRRTADHYAKTLGKWAKDVGKHVGCQLTPVVFDAGTRVKFVQASWLTHAMQVLMVADFCRLLELVLRKDHR